MNHHISIFDEEKRVLDAILSSDDDFDEDEEDFGDEFLDDEEEWDDEDEEDTEIMEEIVRRVDPNFPDI